MILFQSIGDLKAPCFWIRAEGLPRARAEIMLYLVRMWIGVETLPGLPGWNIAFDVRRVGANSDMHPRVMVTI